MKTLYLLRHAKAEPGGKVIGDMDRILSDRGREACIAIGNYLKEKHYTPEFILCSPSARTKETWERVTEESGHFPPYRFADKLYLATAEEILQEIHGIGDGYASALLIGHNPGMHNIALMLANAEDSLKRVELEIKFPTASLAVLRFDVENWGEVHAATGKLIDFVTPQGL